MGLAARNPDDVARALDSREPAKLDELVAVLYEELRNAAHRQLNARRRSAGAAPTLATTALVHEAYLKLAERTSPGWNDDSHFLAVAAIAMRHILVDRARARASLKRGGERRPVTFDEETLSVEDQADVVLEIDEALRALEALEPRLAQVVVARFFGGLSEEEAAKALGVTVRTVQRDWAKARVLLRRALER
jgi:RNA polymerase sigma factor (TIGR02999 family)